MLIIYKFCILFYLLKLYLHDIMFLKYYFNYYNNLLIPVRSRFNYNFNRITMLRVLDHIIT